MQENIADKMLMQYTAEQAARKARTGGQKAIIIIAWILGIISGLSAMGMGVIAYELANYGVSLCDFTGDVLCDSWGCFTTDVLLLIVFLFVPTFLLFLSDKKTLEKLTVIELQKLKQSTEIDNTKGESNV